MRRRSSPRRSPSAAARAAGCRAVIERLESRSMMAVAPLPQPPAPGPAPAVRSYDGTGNNLAHPAWGSSGVQLLRQSPVAYADGVSAPAGADRPSARLVSNLLAAEPDGGILNDRDWSAFVYAWGQFLDHDLGLTVTASPSERLPISVPAGDPWFDPAGTGTMTISMSRSAFDAAVAPGSPRQQTNSISAFIDGSQVYGSDAVRAAAVREFAGGRLRTSTGDLPPFNDRGLANANDAHRVADSSLFLAGDVRANENPELLALHTLFIREHNRIAAQAAGRDPSLTDEQLYQHARRIVVAELQKITYDEFLPALLGPARPGADAVQPYGGYRADVNPGIATEFSTVAFRVGHSMLGDDIEFLAADGTPVRGPLSLRDAFFNPAPLTEVGIEPILKYLGSVRGHEIDTRVVADVRNFLFGAPGQGGFDLAALNIQRGRDHGIGDYNTLRAAYGLPRVTSFAQITPDTAVQNALAGAYGSVDRIDPWVGGLAEKHLPGSSLGATFTRIIVDQFTRLRDGDRFWYQRSLPADALRGVQGTTLTDVIRRNTSLTNLQSEAFWFRTSIGGTVFADANGDGLRQAAEPGRANIAVSLVDAAGAVIATTRTGPGGEYAFNRLALGSYRVSVAAPAGGGAPPTSVQLTRGGAVRGIDIATAAPALAPRPQPPRSAPPRSAPTGLVAAAAFASLAPPPSPATPARRAGIR